tara:strand:- start:3000 stop:3167 length:168 start_codon:yes stop_codon:yes gene_type:complete
MSQSPKLIVVQAFDFDDEGTPQASGEPLQLEGWLSATEIVAATRMAAASLSLNAP